MAHEQRSLVVDAAGAERIDHLIQQLTGLPRSQIKGLFDEGCVSLDGRVCPRPATPVAAGGRVEVDWDPHRRYHPLPRAWEDPAFRLVFEDERLLVVDKEAGVLTVPTPKGETNTLVDAIARYLGRGRNRPVPPGLVHRLDRGVSGLLVFGKDPAATAALRNQFAVHAPLREYEALVAGLVGPDSGTFRSYLLTSASLQRYSSRVEGEGELAITHYVVAERFADTTRVRVRLETGQRNQIRVHFAECGHPVLGDPRYRPDLSAHPCWQADRVALHARLLGFSHPGNRRPLQFTSGRPREFVAFISRTRQG